MKATITKIDPLKESKNKNSVFMRVYFELENKEFAYTDLVPTFRNYPRWKPFLKVNTVLSGIERMADGRVNADSQPVLVSRPEPVNYSVEITEKLETKNLF